MSYKSIINKIDELRTIVGGWSDGKEPASLEMEMALDRVKGIYEMLRFPTEEQQEVTEEAIKEEIQEPIQEPSQPEPLEEGDEEEMHIELVNVTSEEPSAEEEEKELKKNRLNKILSLYESEGESEEEVKAVEEAEEEDVEVNVEDEIKEMAEEEQITTTQTITIESMTIETTVTEPVAIETPTEQEVENPLFELLSLNDRLLLSHELFSGDEAQLIEALHALDLQPTIDDAMIYIAENYSWSGDNEGAQLLMSLLQNRYL